MIQLLHKLPDADATHLQALSGANETAAFDASRQFMAVIYDPKSKFKGTHGSLKLRVRIAATRSASISKLPPCEYAFLQHVKRESWQAKTWTSAHIAEPDVPRPVGAWLENG